METSLQVVHQRVDDFEAKIREVISNVLEQDYLLDGTLDDIGFELNINYSTNKEEVVISGIEISITEDDNITSKHIKDIANAISDEDFIIGVTKYYDSLKQLDYHMYHKEIFEIEMTIREIFTYIFYYNNTDSYWNLLRHSEAKKLSIKGVSNYEDYFKAHYENEFFFMVFNQYKKLDAVQKLDTNDILQFISDSDTFDQFKNNLNSRGIQRQEHLDFIQKVKQFLSSIEEFRNCIAHNRSFTDNTYNNYKHSKEELKKAIEEFWDEVRSEQENN